MLGIDIPKIVGKCVTFQYFSYTNHYFQISILTRRLSKNKFWKHKKPTLTTPKKKERLIGWILCPSQKQRKNRETGPQEERNQSRFKYFNFSYSNTISLGFFIWSLRSNCLSFFLSPFENQILKRESLISLPWFTCAL